MIGAPDLNALVRRSGQVADVAREAAIWLEANRAMLKEDPTALARDFRRFGRRAARLRTAAGRPMGVAVFGASQAGKSYLVNSLATPAGRPLETMYGNQRLNFLRDLNPPGGKESTGLVSRFTLRADPAPRETPVPLRLLSQTDVVKILANAFLEDFEVPNLAPPTPEAIAILFERLSSQGGVLGGGLTSDDVEELREYFDRHFAARPLLRALGPNYWRLAAAVIPTLPPAARAEAYAPLWNNMPALTTIAGELIGALASLNFPDVAFCGLDALMPREHSVLDANLVFGLGEAATTAPIIVAAGPGRASLPRSILAALIAEITIPLAERPWDFFEHTDLLDFPGARSREEITDPAAFLAQPGRLGRVFLRGKVAYLFQRYNDEQEIAAMLLCVGPSNQDVQTLPRMIDEWIGLTIGATPAARAVQRNSLFFVLTQFDREFEEKAGEDPTSGERWSARLQASFLEFFGKSYDWPRNWTPGRAFDNVFWLRSTAIAFDAVFDYAEHEGVKREVGIAARAAGRVAGKRAAYLQTAEIVTHFADPVRAWEEALRPADGGISFLAGQLRLVCDPSTKAAQLSGRVEELATDMAQRLRPYFHTGDLAAELARAKKNAIEVLRALAQCAQAQMFGSLLRSLQVTSDQIAAVYLRLESDANHDLAPIGTLSTEDDYLSALGLDQVPAGPHSGMVARDRYERFVDAALAEWSRTMQELADDADAQAAYRLPREQAATLTGEIWSAARRVKLRDRIATDLRKSSFGHRGAPAAQRPVMLVEEGINGFVYQLGFNQVAPAVRPHVANGARPVFMERPPVAGPPPLGPNPTPYDRNFHIDWMTALGRIFEDNVQDPGSIGLDIAANEALGGILLHLEARRA
jgi:hypothetical protein